MPFETPIPIPATLLVAGLAWAGSMYLLAPTLGKRLLDKSGAIVRCEANFQAAAGAARAKAETALGPPPAQPAAPRAGDLVTGLVLLAGPTARRTPIGSATLTTSTVSSILT